MPQRPRLSFSLAVSPGISALFAEWPMPERLARARACGFDGIEGPPPSDPAALRASLDALGMSFSCMSFARGAAERGELGIACLAGRSQDFKDELARTIDTAAMLGCKQLHPMAGLVPDASSLARCKDVYLDNLHHACATAAAVGMQILIEPICAQRQPRYLLQRAAQALEWISEIGASNLSLILDLYHTAAEGESAPRIAAEHAASIGIVQLAQWPARTQPAQDDPVLCQTLAALDEADWHGWICAEYVPTGPTLHSLDWIRNLHS